MKVKVFTVNAFQMNCYIYYDEFSNEGVIIDPGVSNLEEESVIEDFIHTSGIKIKYIINTHGHLDHVMGNKWAKDFFEVSIYIDNDDIFLVDSVDEQADLFGINIPVLPEFDKYISEGDKISIGNCKLNVIKTPGHSPGSICLVDENNQLIFDGDCLFKNSIGRTDLPGGDMDVLLDSIKNKIFSYPDDFILYPGHMDVTKIGDEKMNNPFLNGEYSLQ